MMQLIKNLESPRVIKTHFSWDMLPEELKKNEKAKVTIMTSDYSRIPDCHIPRSST